MLPFILLALLIGASIPIQVAANTTLRGFLGHPFWVSVAIFALGFVLSLLLALGVRAPAPRLTDLPTVPLWAWSAALLAILYQVGTIIAGPRLGAATLIGLIITGQLVSALLIDHYGLLNFELHRLNWQRILGAALLLGGVTLIRRF